MRQFKKIAAAVLAVSLMATSLLSGIVLPVSAAEAAEDANIVNLALNAVATSSSFFDEGYKAENANDGDMTTYWRSGDGEQSWLCLDFGSATTFAQVDIHWNEAPEMWEFSLQASDDNTTWVDIDILTDRLTPTEDVAVFDEITARYLRINSTNATLIDSKNLVSSIFEVEVYGVAFTEITPGKDKYAFSVNDGSATIFCTDTTISGDVVIPDNIGGYPVTAIGDYAFYNCTSLKSITIPEGVTSIGDYAFYYCESLESITIPDSVMSIGYDAFRFCTSLEAVYITDIAAWCSIDFVYDFMSFYPSNPLYYGASLYLNGELVKDIIIPDGTKSINNYAFYNYKDLESIVIPDGVTSIGDSAFYNCENLESIVVSDSVASIGNSAFYGCEDLEEVYITDIVAWCNITFDYYDSNPLCNGASLYLNGELVKDIVIPDGTKSINNYAFEYCESLESIVIPDSVTSIGDYAFRECTSLKSITIPEGVTSICDYAFCFCESLESIVIPEGVTSIGYEAFYYCTSLESINIPQSVTSMGTGVFGGCGSLEKINIASIESWCAISFTYDSMDENYPTLSYYRGYLCLNGEPLVDITIPSTVTKTNEYVFSGYNKLASVTFSEGVAELDENTFNNCRNLASVVIPTSVTKIDNNAFRNCDKIKHVFYAGSEAEWNEIDIDSGNDYLTSATIHYNATLEDLKTTNVVESCTQNRQTSHYCNICQSEYHNAIIQNATGHTVIDGACKNCDYIEDDTFTFDENAMTATGVIAGTFAGDIAFEIKDKNGNVLASDALIGTGCTVTVNAYVYVIIISGDSSGDGQVNSTDFMQVRRQYLGLLGMTDSQFFAADVNNDGNINSTDFTRIRRHFLGLYDLYA